MSFYYAFLKMDNNIDHFFSLFVKLKNLDETYQLKICNTIKLNDEENITRKLKGVRFSDLIDILNINLRNILFNNHNFLQLFDIILDMFKVKKHFLINIRSEYYKKELSYEMINKPVDIGMFEYSISYDGKEIGSKSVSFSKDKANLMISYFIDDDITTELIIREDNRAIAFDFYIEDEVSDFKVSLKATYDEEDEE